MWILCKALSCSFWCCLLCVLIFCVLCVWIRWLVDFCWWWWLGCLVFWSVGVCLGWLVGWLLFVVWCWLVWGLLIPSTWEGSFAVKVSAAELEHFLNYETKAWNKTTYGWVFKEKITINTKSYLDTVLFV